MSHENSETIKGRDGQWYNVYDGTPYPLPQIFGFEKQPYATMEEAENKAAWRSASGHSEDYAKQSPQYGFSNTYEPSPQAKALGKVIDILNDPRNAWMGMGGVTRGMRLLSPMGKGPEMGGFRESTKLMRRAIDAPRENLRAGEVPGGEAGVRSMYHGQIESVNELANSIIKNPGANIKLHGIDLPVDTAQFMKDFPELEPTILNLNRLQHYTKIAPHTTYGKEGVPPQYLMNKFGFK